MYRIIKTDGTEVGCTDSVLYIKVAKNGCYIQCEQPEAVGVAYQSTAYNLSGHSEIAGADQVIMVKQDGGRRIQDLESVNADLTEAACNLLYEFDKLKLGVTES